MELTVRRPGDQDLMAMLMADKRSDNTKRAYQKDLEEFFLNIFGEEASPTTIEGFLALSREQMTFAVLEYKAGLLGKGLAEATVNRRLSAIKSLVAFAYRVGKVSFKLDIQGEKVKAYRDAWGTDAAGIKSLLLQPNRLTAKGKRDYAILRLLWENALRRAEVIKLDVKDFRPEENRLFILGKGKGGQKEPITISGKVKAAITEYLATRKAAADDPLFINCDRAKKGNQLTGEGLYYIVKYYSKKAGMEKALAPHMIRHSSITAALDATGGDIRKVQRLSRHAKVETLLIYDDNREDFQGEVSQLLANQT